MMKVVNADKIKAKYPNRKSLNQVMDNARNVSITEIIEDVKADMCDNYCKIPYKYSANEWEEICFSKDSPCNNCPLDRL